MKCVGRDHLKHREVGDGCQGMRVEIERTGWRSCTSEVDVLETVFNQFANAQTAVDMWNDLEQELGLGKRGQHRRRISGFCL